MAGFNEMFEGARDAMSVRRVFGDPIERDGVTVVPVASVSGGGGGGEGGDEGSEGTGGGFGLRARPVGVYVIRGDEVEWQPALDVTRVSLMAMGLAAFAILMLGGGHMHRRSRG